MLKQELGLTSNAFDLVFTWCSQSSSAMQSEPPFLQIRLCTEDPTSESNWRERT